MISRTNSVWLSECLKLPVVSWHYSLTSAPWTNHLFTELYPPCKVLTWVKCTYLVGVNVHHICVFHLLIKCTFHLSLLYHLKLLLDLVCRHSLLSQVYSRPASWFLWRRLMTVLCVLTTLDAALSHRKLLWLEISNESARRLQRISHLKTWHVRIFSMGNDSWRALSLRRDRFAWQFKPRRVLPWF